MRKKARNGDRFTRSRVYVKTMRHKYFIFFKRKINNETDSPYQQIKGLIAYTVYSVFSACHSQRQVLIDASVFSSTF
jgi:hypothetical protein